jgi:cytochrome c-type biogenesis protein CcmH
MTILLALLFLALSFMAAAFAVIPALRPGAPGTKPSRLRGAFAAMAVLIVGLGLYGALGQPALALRALQNQPDPANYEEMVATLAQRIRERPNDVQGWTILGRGYLTLGEGEQAVRAFRRALQLAEAQGGATSTLLVDYALASALAEGGVSDEVESLLARALALDPANTEARYYLGLAHADRGEAAEALALWEQLLTDAPANAPWREALPAQIAALRGEAPGASPGAPDISAMVDGLAARLAQSPDDLEGWVMLVRAYAVLGQADNARSALSSARTFFADDAQALAMLSAQAAASGLE